MFTIAFIEVKMLDWIVFALQYAFESLVSTFIVVVLALTVILGVFACLWGWLWNKKWGPFTSGIADLLVCTAISLLFALASVALHGLSSNNFGMGVMESRLMLKCRNYSEVPKKERGNLPTSQVEALEKMIEGQIEGEPRKTPYEAISTIHNLTWKSEDRYKVVHDFATRLLDADNFVKKYRRPEKEKEIMQEGDAGATARAAFYADYNGWSKGAAERTKQLTDCYKETVLTLVVLWWSLMVMMLLYAAWRAFTGIKVTPYREKLDSKIQAWVNEAADAKEQQLSEE